MTVRPGTVYLVGAGPGDPGLVTVRGMELLRRADVIAHDRLIDEALLAQAPPRTQLIDVGKQPEGSSASQTNINALLVEHAKRGRVVVRLKGGDPLMFGRGHEEWLACREAGVPCEIVPGVTSALAGPAAAGIPVTLRGGSRSAAIVTAETESGEFNTEAIVSVAKADTIVILMGVRRLQLIVHALLDAGRDRTTPVAIIERATRPGQREVRGPLHQIVEIAQRENVRSPAVIVVGETAALGAAADGPLRGRRVVVTRPAHAAKELCDSLRALGADVLLCPLIRIEHVNAVIRNTENTEGMNGCDSAGVGADGLKTSSLDDSSVFSVSSVFQFSRQSLEQFDWLVFTSRHGVRGFRRAFERAGGDVRWLAHLRIAAVGPITAREVQTWSMQPDLCPSSFRADALCDELLALDRPPQRVLFPCGTLALETVPRRLAERGIHVTPLTVYQTLRTHIDDHSRSLIERGVDAILLASPSAAAALVESNVDVRNAAIICIGPTTASAAASLGLRNIHTAHEHADSGMIATAIKAFAPEAVNA